MKNVFVERQKLQNWRHQATNRDGIKTQIGNEKKWVMRRRDCEDKDLSLKPTKIFKVFPTKWFNILISDCYAIFFSWFIFRWKKMKEFDNVFMLFFLFSMLFIILITFHGLDVFDRGCYTFLSFYYWFCHNHILKLTFQFLCSLSQSSYFYYPT